VELRWEKSIICIGGKALYQDATSMRLISYLHLHHGSLTTLSIRCEEIVTNASASTRELPVNCQQTHYPDRQEHPGRDASSILHHKLQIQVEILRRDMRAVCARRPDRTFVAAATRHPSHVVLPYQRRAERFFHVTSKSSRRCEGSPRLSSW
jgi:hypothetical protein